MSTAKQHLTPREAKHQLTPREVSELELQKVQQRVLSILIIGVSTFPVGALIGISGVMVRQGRHGAAIALLMMCAVVGMVAVGSACVFRGKSLLTPILLLGALPAVVAAVVIL